MTDRSRLRVPGEIVRLLLLILVAVPLVVLLIGPILVWAALRGAQQVGPIIVNPGRQGNVGRLLALVLGLLLWVLVWGGIFLLLAPFGRPAAPPGSESAGGTVQLVVSQTVEFDQTSGAATLTSQPATSSPHTDDDNLSASTENDQTAEAVGPTQVLDPEVESPTAPTQSDPSPVPLVETVTPSSMPPTLTPPAPVLAPSATAVPPAPSPTSTAFPSPMPTGTLSPQLASEAMSSVETANEILRRAVADPSADNLFALEKVWKGNALIKAQEFAKGPTHMVGRPITVSYVYRVPPSVSQGPPGSPPDTLLASSIEIWTYSGPDGNHSEEFRFVYTLEKQDQGWVIMDYAFLGPS